jgi:hypothetical protein
MRKIFEIAKEWLRYELHKIALIWMGKEEM